MIISKKAEDVIIIDVRELTSLTDYFVICTGTSDTHVKTIHDVIIKGMYTKTKPWNVEGLNSLNWVLMDFVDVVIHIFQKEQREFYALERLWADGNIDIIQDDLAKD